MTSWTTDELSRIGDADEVRIASRQLDGTLRRPVTIWVVRLGDDLYVRSVNGQDAAWVQGTQVRSEGWISAGGVDKDVRFEGTDRILEEIDAAYVAKYSRYGATIVGSTLTPQARSTTLRLVPNDSTHLDAHRVGQLGDAADGE